MTSPDDVQALIERMKRAARFCENAGAIAAIDEGVDALTAAFGEIDQLKEALTDWRNCWLCPGTEFDGQVERLLRETSALLEQPEKTDA